ncbi:MAG: prolyl oligopeptidase family serine peptidase [Cyclobacteriaceae bacterium]
MHLTKPAKILFTGILFLLFINSVILAQEAEVPFTEHFGQKVDHPYLWLEDVESDTVQSWIKKQEDYKWEHFNRSDFKTLLNRFSYRQGISKSESDEYSIKVEFEEYYPPEIWIWAKERDNGHKLKIKLKDYKRNKFDRPSLANFIWSDRLDIMVFFISHSHSDWKELVVYDLRSMEPLYSIQGVLIPWVEFQGDGFIYERYDEPEKETKSKRLNQRICHHSIGTDPKDDHLLFFNQDNTSQRTFEIYEPKNSDWLIISHPFKNGNNWLEAISLIDMEDPLFKTRTIAVYDSPFQLEFDYVRESDSSIFFRTNMLNPKFQLLEFDIYETNKIEVVVDAYKEVLNEATHLGDGYCGLEYMDGGKFFGVVVDSLGQDKLALPVGYGAALDYYVTSKGQAMGYLSHYHTHGMRFKFDLDPKEISYDFSKSIKPRNLDDYEIVITEYPGADGVLVPVTIIHKKRKFDKDGANVALIDVYGGYGLVQTPSYNLMNNYLLANGGVLVIPGVRGSGAKGTDWAAAGRDINKQNTIDDIISCAEFLIAEGYTSSDKLIMEGGSHGGFAVSAAAIQRPDLFKGVIVNSGAQDLVGLTNQTSGHNELNRIEFGNPDDSLSFMSRLKLSPLHSLSSGVDYPSFLVIGGVNDTRVPVFQSLRFYALLQEKSQNKFNFLHLTNGGHSVYDNPYEVLTLLSFKLKFIHDLTGKKLWLKDE